MDLRPSDDLRRPDGDPAAEAAYDGSADTGRDRSTPFLAASPARARRSFETRLSSLLRSTTHWSPGSAVPPTNGIAIGCCSTSCPIAPADAVFAKSVQQFPDLLRRSCWRTDLAGNDPRSPPTPGHHLGVLPDDLRLEAADTSRIRRAHEPRCSFFDEPECWRSSRRYAWSA